MKSIQLTSGGVISNAEGVQELNIALEAVGKRHRLIHGVLLVLAILVALPAIFDLGYDPGEWMLFCAGVPLLLFILSFRIRAYATEEGLVLQSYVRTRLFRYDELLGFACVAYAGAWNRYIGDEGWWNFGHARMIDVYPLRGSTRSLPSTMMGRRAGERIEELLNARIPAERSSDEALVSDRLATGNTSAPLSSAMRIDEGLLVSIRQGVGWLGSPVEFIRVSARVTPLSVDEVAIGYRLGLVDAELAGELLRDGGGRDEALGGVGGAVPAAVVSSLGADEVREVLESRVSLDWRYDSYGGVFWMRALMCCFLDGWEDQKYPGEVERELESLLLWWGQTGKDAWAYINQRRPLRVLLFGPSRREWLRRRGREYLEVTAMTWVDDLAVLRTRRGRYGA